MRIIAKDTFPEVPSEEFKRLLGVPSSYVFEGPVKSLAEWVPDWFRAHAHPWIFARLLGKVELHSDGVVLENTVLKSRALCRHLQHGCVSRAVVVAVGAGPEAEAAAAEYWRDGHPDRYFFIEAYASAVVEALVAESRRRICAWAEPGGLGVLRHCSPGYHGWSITDQAALLATALPESETLPGPLGVMESGMLHPKKSQLALFGITDEPDRVKHRDELVSCKICPMRQCTYRRNVYRNPSLVREET